MAGTLSASRSRGRGQGSFTRGFLWGVVAVLAVVAVINHTRLADWAVAPLVVEDTAGSADVIVVVAAGVVRGCQPNSYSTRRVLLALEQWRRGRAPLMLFTGGVPEGFTCSVAEVMATLAEELGVPRHRMLFERTSTNTFENARESLPALRAVGARRLLVVTDRLHMRRAAGVFAGLGFEVERASVPIYLGHPSNLDMTRAAVREALASVYYRMRGWTVPVDSRVSGGHAVRPPAGNAIEVNRAMWKHPNGPIVVLGASYARGWTPTIAGLAVENRGEPGQQSFELVARFQRDVIARQPRAVIIWGFINDIFRSSPDKMTETMDRALASMRDMVRLAREHGIEPILATEVTVRPPAAIAETIATWIGRALGRDSYQSRVNRQVLAMNERLRNLAREEGVLLLDLMPQLSDHRAQRARPYATEDGSHISAAGYAQLTAYAVPLLTEHLSRQTQPHHTENGSNR